MKQWVTSELKTLKENVKNVKSEDISWTLERFNSEVKENSFSGELRELYLSEAERPYKNLKFGSMPKLEPSQPRTPVP